MKVRLGDVLRECRRRGISFSDEKGAYQKQIENAIKIDLAITDYKNKLAEIIREMLSDAIKRKNEFAKKKFMEALRYGREGDARSYVLLTELKRLDQNGDLLK